MWLWNEIKVKGTKWRDVIFMFLTNFGISIDDFSCGMKFLQFEDLIQISGSVPGCSLSFNKQILGSEFVVLLEPSIS